MADEVSRGLPPNPLVRAPFTQYVTVLKESTQAYKKLKPNPLTRPVFVLDIPLRPSQWGKFAKAGELAAAAEALVREKDPVMVVSLSRIFDMRKFPLDPAPLVRHLNSKHNAVVFATYRLLEKLKTPVVREAGLKHFNHNEWGHRAADLLVTNYRVGDLNLHYERLLELRRNPEDIHSYGMSAEKAAGRFLEKDMKSPAAAEEKNVAKKLLTLLYEELPCSMCREYVFKRLRSQRWVTKEMRTEWELDAVTLEERCPLV